MSKPSKSREQVSKVRAAGLAVGAIDGFKDTENIMNEKTMETDKIDSCEGPSNLDAVFIDGVEVTAKALAAAGREFFSMIGAMFDADGWPKIDLRKFFLDDLGSANELAAMFRGTSGIPSYESDLWMLQNDAERALIVSDPEKYGISRDEMARALARRKGAQKKSSTTA